MSTSVHVWRNRVRDELSELDVTGLRPPVAKLNHNTLCVVVQLLKYVGSTFMVINLFM